MLSRIPPNRGLNQVCNSQVYVKNQKAEQRQKFLNLKGKR